MTSQAIKVKAFAVLLNKQRDAHLVWRGSDVTKIPSEFHRLLGGHVEFGEATVEAVEREILEETGVVLTGGWLADNGQPIRVEWRSVRLAGSAPPPYPLGVQALIDRTASA